MGSGTHFSKLMGSQEPMEPMLTEPLERELITKDMLHGYVRMYLEYNRRWVETMLSAVCLLYLYVSLSSQDNSMSGEPP